MELFRKEAVENASVRTDKASAARAVGVKYTLFAAALALCAAIFTVWLLFGEIYETVSVDGIIWPNGSDDTVYSERSGTVSKTTGSRGSSVKAGDILAVIPQESILEKIRKRSSDAELAALREEYDKYSFIRSDVDGIVTYIADENAYVGTGEKIAVITPYSESGNNMKLTAFIPSGKGELVSLGMEAQVMPEFTPREKYGYINAYVSGISQYPIKGEYIKNNMSNLYMPSLEEGNNYLQLEITLLADASTASRLKWSNSVGASIDAPMGTVCKADIVIDKRPPFRWPF